MNSILSNARCFGVLLLFAGASCKGAKTPAPNDVSCADQVKLYETWIGEDAASFEEDNVIGDVLPLPVEFAKLRGAVNPATAGEPVLAVSNQGVFLDGSPIIPGDASLPANAPYDVLGSQTHGVLVEYAESRADKAQASKVGFVISGDARWEQVAAALSAAAKARYAASMYFSVARTLPAAPKPSAFGDAMTAPGADHAKLSKELLAACPAMNNEFTKAAEAPPANRQRALYKGLLAAAEACDCKPSPQDIQTWYWHLGIAALTRPTTVVPVAVTIATSETGTVVSAPRAATWRDVAPKFLAAAAGGPVIVRIDAQ